MEHNNGVYYRERLQPVPAEAGAGAWATGVKRSADKVCIRTLAVLNRVATLHGLLVGFQIRVLVAPQAASTA